MSVLRRAIIYVLLALGLSGIIPVSGQSGMPIVPKSTTTISTMTVEIWSDVMCPFCYIGKRRFETALAQFAGQDSVQIIWRSFQLNPDLQTEPDKSVARSLQEQKGWTDEQTREAMTYVTEMAKTVGLHYNFDKAVVANSFDAHRFTHFAKSKGKQMEAEERLFAAYFSEGKNTADHQTLAQLGADIGLDSAQVLQVLATNAFADAVEQDIEQARQFRISGVPFFVFNRKFAVSGAQEPAAFLQALEAASQAASGN